MKNRLALMAAMAALFIPALAEATDVIGRINSDTRWTLAGSPYRLTGDVTVASQATLTLEPGVIVEAAATDAMSAGTDTSKVELVIEGALLANGTASAPILFRGASQTANAWSGIAFQPGARASSLTFVQVSDANHAIYVRSTAAVTLSDLSLSRSVSGIVWQAGASAIIERSSIDTMTGEGIFLAGDGVASIQARVSACRISLAAGAGIHVSDKVTARVERTAFVSNGVGCVADSGSALQFVNNLVIANTLKGLAFAQAGTNAFAIINNTFDRNMALTTPSAGIGIHALAIAQTSAVIIRNNIITNHGIAGIKVEGATGPSLDHNDVWGNATDYQGTTAGPGSLSVNPLYQTPFGGDWRFVAQYVNRRNLGTNLTFRDDFDHPGAAAMRLRFSFLQTESGYDYLKVYDANNAVVASYTGSPAVPLTTPAASGSHLHSVFTSDQSNSSPGYTIEGYEYVPVDSRYNYRLQASSPVIDLGSDLDAPTVDFDGTARPYDGDTNGTPTTDLGAFEWHENVAPYAVAGSDHTVLPGTSLAFDAAGSRDPDGQIVSYDWNFGDGSAHATTVAATHTYSSLGTFTVTLTVTDDQGATGTDTATVVVADNLPPLADAGPDQYVDVGQSVTLDGSGSSDSDGNIVAYAWDFGDGTPAGNGRIVTHAFARAGVFTATLTVTDNRNGTSSDTAAVVVGGSVNNEPPVAVAGGPYSVAAGSALQVDGSGSSDSDGTLSSYAWSFGDGTTGTGAAVSHTYAAAGTFLLQLTVTDDDGATGQDATLVTVTAQTNQPPVADAGGNHTSSVNQAVSFDGSGSSDPDGTLASYAWDFGDGSSGTGRQTTHTFTAAGTYLVRLTVTDNHGATDSDVAIATVNAPNNRPPVADAGGDKSGGVNQAISFDASGSSDPDGTLASYAWDFGDGVTGSGRQTTHSYAASGTFLARLTVTDDDGATGQDIALVTVSAQTNQPPVANAGGDRSGMAGEALAFDGSRSSDPDGTIASYAWDFGDGSTGTGRQTTHAYAAAGTYLVRLTVTDDRGASAQDVGLASVSEPGNQPPVAKAGGNRSAAVGETVSFDASASSDPDGTLSAYAWSFGDGTMGAGAQVTHAFAAKGTFLVNLTVTDDKGAEGHDMAVVVVGAQQNLAPTAAAGGNRSAKVNEELAFDASASSDPDGHLVSQTWDFGDGTILEGVQAKHAFSAAGSFLVRLTVTDDAGASAQDFAMVTVTEESSGAAVEEGGCAAAPGVASGFFPAILLVAPWLAMRRRRE